MITENMVKAAAENSGNGEEVMAFLLEQRGADVAITEKVVKTVAEGFDENMMMLLLEQRGADVAITKKMMKAAATCGQDGVLKIIEKNFEISPSKEE